MHTSTFTATPHLETSEGFDDLNAALLRATWEVGFLGAAAALAQALAEAAQRLAPWACRDRMPRRRGVKPPR